VLGTGSVCACGGGFGAVSTSASGGALTTVSHLLLLLTYGKGGATWLSRLGTGWECDIVWMLEQLGTFRRLPHMSDFVHE